MYENNLILNNTNYMQNIEQEDEIYILFEVEKKIFALNAKKVLEITKIIEMEYPNQMPSCFLGLIEYEKKPVGVLDIREVFKMPRRQYNINAKIILYDCVDTKIAFICDKVLDVRKLEKVNISSMPYQQEKLYRGIYIHNNESIYILNGKNIVSYIENNIDEFKYRENPKIFLPSCDNETEILKERKNLIKQNENDIQNQKPLYDMGVTFSINDIKYYINMSNVKEFFKVNNSKFTKIPNVPDFIYGLINIKGEYISVLDLRRFSSNTYTTIKDKSTIIIINSNEFKMGILADEILETINIDEQIIAQNATKKQEDSIITEFVNNNEIYQIININQLLQDSRLTIC